MRRDKLLDLLDDYASRFPGEDVSGFIGFVRRQPRCFDRDCFDDGHVTGSAWVVDTAGVRTLLTHHAKLKAWLQPGGHSDGDADPLAVAWREAQEETGLTVVPVDETVLDVDVHAIPAHGSDPPHFHYDVRFAFRVVGSHAYQVSAESLDLKWVPMDELTSVTNEESMLRMARKWSLSR